jgi:GGDEF domain-containing protein
VLRRSGALALATFLIATPAAAGPVPSFPPTPTLPASQADRDRLAAYDEALVALTQELAYLVLLGWVESPVPAEASQLPMAIGIQRTDDATMLEQLRLLDGKRGPAALDGLRALGLPVTPAVETVLVTNLPTERAAGAVDLPSIGVGVYLQAYEQLLDPRAALMGVDGPTGPADPVSQPVPAPVATGPSTATVPSTVAEQRPASVSSIVVAATTAAPTTAAAADATAADATAADVTGPAGARSNAVLLAVGVGAVLTLAATGAVVVGRRRRHHPGAAGVAGDAVLDAGRSIMAAVDLDGFLGAVAEQVGRLVGAEGAVIVDGRSWVPAGRELPGAAVLDRAMATGRSVVHDGTTVVPVVAHGHVVGVMVAWTTRPSTEETLGAFAPLVGAALQGVRSRLEHEHLAFDDGLTGVGNRRRFDRDLERFVGIDSDRGLPVALAMVDVDHFKRFNDAHGHQTGDAVLRHVASLISANVRNGDLVYRYGGEEFAVLLPGADLDDAVEVVERVPVGVSVTPPADGAAMVRAADGALYAAKSGGRNRVEAFAAPA